MKTQNCVDNTTLRRYAAAEAQVHSEKLRGKRLGLWALVAGAALGWGVVLLGMYAAGWLALRLPL